MAGLPQAAQLTGADRESAREKTEAMAIKVLIIDDEPGTVDMLKSFFGLFGIEAEGALTGEAGLKSISAKPPNVLILDLMLPDIDGYEICRRLRMRDETKDLPIAMLSARTTRDDVRRGYAAGASRYLKKPVDLNNLLEIVQNLAEQAKHAAPPKDQQEQDALAPPSGMSGFKKHSKPAGSPEAKEEEDKPPRKSPYPTDWKFGDTDTRPIPGQFTRRKAPPSKKEDDQST
jgi:CheY-like chemotaxis protein